MALSYFNGTGLALKTTDATNESSPPVVRAGVSHPRWPPVPEERIIVV
jgi:hypothetical protein